MSGTAAGPFSTTRAKRMALPLLLDLPRESRGVSTCAAAFAVAIGASCVATAQIPLQPGFSAEARYQRSLDAESGQATGRFRPVAQP
jgi:hypothetical protein